MVKSQTEEVNIKLLIDDERDPKDYGKDCYVARNYNEGIYILDTEKIEELYLDGDLGSSKGGIHVLLWIMASEKKPNKITMVTSSNFAAIAMGKMCVDIGYNQISEREYQLKCQ